MALQLWPDEEDARVQLLLVVHEQPVYPPPEPPPAAAAAAPQAAAPAPPQQNGLQQPGPAERGGSGASGGATHSSAGDVEMEDAAATDAAAAAAVEAVVAAVAGEVPAEPAVAMEVDDGIQDAAPQLAADPGALLGIVSTQLLVRRAQRYRGSMNFCAALLCTLSLSSVAWLLRSG